MLNDSLLPLVAPVLSFLGAVIVGAIAGFWNSRTKRIENEASPYSELAKRVTALEQSVQALEAERTALRAEVEQLKDQRRDDRNLIRALVAHIESHLPHTPFPFRLPAWLRTKDPEEE